MVSELWARDVDLSRHNTLALPSLADHVVTISAQQQLPAVFRRIAALGLPWWVLGGGSNVLLPPHLAGVVVLMRTRGIELLHDHGDHVELEVAAGENWDDVVAHCCAQHWHGLENLSLIPGSAGAAPVQNIGAYGVEIAQFIVAVEYFDVRTQQLCTLDNAGCEFRYRDSVFKHALRGGVVITRVRLRLYKDARVNIEYPALRSQFGNTTGPTPREVREAVIAVRRSKLPDPAVLPNAGSFFKNPIVSAAQFTALQQQDPRLVHYPQADGTVKLAAGYLIERCGWRGRACGAAGVHELQALVLVNRGGASIDDLLRTADAIRADVAARYGVTLDIEPDVIGQHQGSTGQHQ
jgi:UDP-N-acetylmuramate dehydrogenase